MPQAERVLREALTDPGTRGFAILGLEDTKSLSQLLREGISAATRGDPVRNSTPESRRLALRAARRLLELGSEEGLGFLLDNISETSHFESHVTLASLADYLQDGARMPRARQQTLDKLFSPVLLGKLPWDDMETEYLYCRVLALLDPDSESDNSSTLDFLDNL